MSFLVALLGTSMVSGEQNLYISYLRYSNTGQIAEDKT